MPDGEEPLAVARVTFASGARHQVITAWQHATTSTSGRGSGTRLYADADAFCDLVVQCLSRDIRSTHQRCCQRTPPGHDQGGVAEGVAQHDDDRTQRRGHWRVVLDRVNVGYELDDSGGVTITDAHPHAASAEADSGGGDEAPADGGDERE